MGQHDYDERYEPGYDPGPEPDRDCEEWGVAVFARELTDDGCVHCTEHDYGPDTGHHDDDLIDVVGFADPGGRSALRAATRHNPRNLPCPTCGAADVLTPADVAAGYQCDGCADRAEHGGY